MRILSTDLCTFWVGQPMGLTVAGFNHQMLGRSRAPLWQWCCTVIKKDEPREPALHLAARSRGQVRTTTSVVPPHSSLLILEERKPWGHLDQASAGRMLPFLCSSGSQSHGINSSEAGSPLRGLGRLPYSHMAQDTLFFVTAACPGGLRTSAENNASGALNSRN